MSFPRRGDTDIPPTARLPRIGRDRTRTFLWVAVAGAVVMTVAAVLAVARSGDDDRPAGSAWVTSASGTPASEAVDSTMTGEPSPTPRPSKRPVPPARSTDELIDALRATIHGLERAGQLSGEAEEELTKGLDETAKEWTEGDVGKAREKLAEFAAKVVDLRREGKLSDGAYRTVAGGLTLLAQSLSPR